MSYHSNEQRSTRGRSCRHSPIAALCVALLALGATPCAGRTSLRGSAMTPHTSVRERRNRVQYGKRRWLQQGPQSVAAKATPAPSAVTEHDAPNCTTLFVPTVAGNLTGMYTHAGRYNGDRPVYSDPATGNNIFSQSGGGPPDSNGSTSWFITQGDASRHFFLSIESEVFEPTDLEGLQPWVRVNDPLCHNCYATMVIGCKVWTADLYTPAPTTVAGGAFPSSDDYNATLPYSEEEAGGGGGGGNETRIATTPTPTPAPTIAPTTTLWAGGQQDGGEDPTATSDPTAETSTETSTLAGCVNLDIDNGGDRAGIYLLSDATYSNGRPGYTVAAGNRTDEVFSTRMSVCADGWGVVNATWVEATGELPSNASASEVFLMYVAENPDLGVVVGNDCEVDVWMITSGGASTLDEAGEHTFVSVSDLEDPSEVTTWAKFTPATATKRATLVENFWIKVGCATADEVTRAEAQQANALEVTAPPEPVGKEPHGKQ